MCSAAQSVSACSRSLYAPPNSGFSPRLAALLDRRSGRLRVRSFLRPAFGAKRSAHRRARRAHQHPAPSASSAMRPRRRHDKPALRHRFSQAFSGSGGRRTRTGVARIRLARPATRWSAFPRPSTMTRPTAGSIRPAAYGSTPPRDSRRSSARPRSRAGRSARLRLFRSTPTGFLLLPKQGQGSHRGYSSSGGGTTALTCSPWRPQASHEHTDADDAAAGPNQRWSLPDIAAATLSDGRGSASRGSTTTSPASNQTAEAELVNALWIAYA